MAFPRDDERSNAITYNRNYAYHAAWAGFLSGQDFTHVLTLQWNRIVGFDRVRADLKKLHQLVDRELLGTRYHKKANRTEALFFLEGEENLTLHAHSFWKVATEHQDDFRAMFPEEQHSSESLWRCVIPSGTHDLQLNSKPGAAAIYLTKQVHLGSDDRRIIFTQDFIPSRPVAVA